MSGEAGPAEGRAPAGPQGLTDAQAAERLRADGPNVLPQPDRRGLPRIAAGVFAQPMFLLLLATAAAYLLLGSPDDAIAMLASVLAVGALAVYQQQRTERVMQSLRDLSSPRCTVVRGGRRLRIAARELVRGDLLVVEEGDRLAADAALLAGNGVRVDESQLTGESAPVGKQPLGEGPRALLQAGSLVVQGEGMARVNATGAATALGRIGHSLAGARPRPSRLQAEIRRLVWRVAALALALCLLTAGVYALREGSWSSGVLAGLTLAMALIPEEFAVVWTVMLALGAWRLSRHGVLTRQPQAIEALGSATVLCTDKTGTLTRNQMTLAQLHDGDRAVQAACLGTAGDAPATAQLLQAALQCSVLDGIEPMDRAVGLALRGAAAEVPSCWTAGPRQGVRAGQPYVSHWWRAGGVHRVAVKGAPETVLARCDGAPQRLEGLRAAARQWSAAGLRVLAVAQGHATAPQPDGGLPPGLRLEALGLLGFEDPVRDEVPRAVAQCREAGVRVVMITGDSALTGAAIARQAGLVRDGACAVLTGDELAGLDEAQLALRVAGIQVYARVDPAQKLRIVQALQQRGEVVAMTGDGVNDAPALRRADIGVAMGGRGTDVAREAADLVLLDDDFTSLVQAVRAGRRIFANLRSALGYIFAVHVPIVGVSLLPVVLGGPTLLLPLHVVLLELIIDPACSLVFEADAAPDGSMRAGPRPAGARLFSAALAGRALAAGGAAFGGVLAVQALAHALQAGPDALRLASLASIVAANLLLLAWFRRGRSSGAARANRPLLALQAAISGLWALLLGVPAASALFGLPAVAPIWSLLAALPGAWALWRLLGARGQRLRQAMS